MWRRNRRDDDAARTHEGRDTVSGGIEDMPESSPDTPVQQCSVIPESPATGTPRHAAPDPQDSPIDRPGQPPLRGFGRIGVHDVQPVVEGGRLPAYAVVDEEFEVTAHVFREGHDKVGATVVLTAPDGRELRTDMCQQEPMGLDIWSARVHADATGSWTMHVEGWSNLWHTWHHAAQAKLAADIDVDLVRAEGVRLAEAAFDRARDAGHNADSEIIGAGLSRLKSAGNAQALLTDVVGWDEFCAVMARHADRDLVSPTQRTPLLVERRRALYGSWYEFFLRSQGAHRRPDGSWVSGTFASSEKRLDEIAAMGFDVVYLPPIHPIGSAFRKGPNNTLDAGPNDPGSPWAIGSPDGGHDSIHPDLGTFDDFDHFVAHAHSLGLEVALDFALQASPDHPWVHEHPEWFTTRVDGTIAYAENPPKKYQDIYPINFDNDPEGIYHECVRILELWIAHGVTIFRVDNPHTKPINFWAWLMATMRRRHPEVIFLAEAFTRPEMMQALAKVGFQQGYSYFVWRSAKWELEEFLTEVSTQTSAWYRPNFFVNTPDINPYYLQDGNPAAFAIRAILAATMSPSWGMYSGYELCEHVPLPGREEYDHSEKYEYRPRDYSGEPNLSVLITRLNEIRREHSALQQLRDVTIHHAPDDRILVFSKKSGSDVVIVAVSLDPVWGASSQVMLDMAALGLDPDVQFDVHDELTGADFTWSQQAWVNLYPAQPAHILTVRGSH